MSRDDDDSDGYAHYGASCKNCGTYRVEWARWRDTGKWVLLDSGADMEKGEVVYCDELYEGKRTVRKAMPEDDTAGLGGLPLWLYTIHYKTCIRNR